MQHICGCSTGPRSSPNTHIHIFFARRDPADNKWYFFDPYGIYWPPDCYPDSGDTVAEALPPLNLLAILQPGKEVPQNFQLFQWWKCFTEGTKCQNQCVLTRKVAGKVAGKMAGKVAGSRLGGWYCQILMPYERSQPTLNQLHTTNIKPKSDE